MPARPGGRRYNSEVRIVTSLEKLNPAKRGLQSLGQMMSGLMLSSGKMQGFTENLVENIKRSGVESNVWLTSLNDINTQYDAVLDMVRELSGTSPIDVDPEQLHVYLDMMEDVIDLRTEIGMMSEEQKEWLGLNEANLERLETISAEYVNMSDYVHDASDALQDLTLIQEDLAEVGKRLAPLYNGAKNEIGLMVGELKNASETSKEFFGMFDRSFGVIKSFFAPVTSSIKSAAAEMAKDKISKYIYSKLVPSGEAAASAIQKGTGATSGLSGALNKLIPGLTGTTTAATETAGGMTATAGASASASGAMGGATASAGGLAAALGPIAVVAAVVVAALVVVVGVLAAFTKGLQMNIKTMEKYRQASFRATGSIRELSDATYDLSTSIGVSNDEAVASIKALSESGFAFSSLGESVQTTTGRVIKGQDALARLAKTNAMFTKATGASVTATAGLQKSMTAMGVAIDKQEALFGQLSIAATKYSVTGEELTSIIRTLADQSILLNDVLDKTDFNKYAARFTVMAGAAKGLGLDVAVANRAMKDIAEGSDRAMSLTAFGGGDVMTFFDDDAVNNIDEVTKAAKKIWEDSKQYHGNVRKAILESTGWSMQEMKLLAETADLRASMTDAELQAEADLAANRAKSAEIYNNSLQTISQQMQRLFAPVLAGIAKVVGPMVDGLIEFFEGADLGKFGKALTDIMGVVGAVFGPVLQIMGETFKLISEVFDVVYTAIEPLMPILKLIGGAIMSGILLPFRAIIAVLRIITAVILKPLAESIAWVLEPFKQAGNWISENMIDPLSEVSEWVKIIGEWWDKTIAPMNVAKGALSDILLGFAPILNVVSAIKSALFGSSMFHIKESVDEDIGPALKILFGLFEVLMMPLTFIKSMIGGIVDFISAIPDAMSAAFGKITSLGQKAMGTISGIASSAWNTVEGLGKGLKNNLVGAAGWVGGKLEGAASTASDIVKAGANSLVSAAGWVGSKIGGLFGESEPIGVNNAPQIRATVASPNQTPPAYTVQVEERANNQARLVAQLTESSEISRQILTRMLNQLNDDTPAGRETAERLKKLVEIQEESGASYPDVGSGFGERVNVWYS